MEIYTQEKTDGKKPTKIIIQIDLKEARTLMDMADEAHKSNKRKTSFRTMRKAFSEKLCCF